MDTAEPAAIKPISPEIVKVAEPSCCRTSPHTSWGWGCRQYRALTAASAAVNHPVPCSRMPQPSSRPARLCQAGCRAAGEGIATVWGSEVASRGSFLSRCSMMAACRAMSGSPCASWKPACRHFMHLLTWLPVRLQWTNVCASGCQNQHARANSVELAATCHCFPVQSSGPASTAVQPGPAMD